MTDRGKIATIRLRKLDDFAELGVQG